ncbi:methyltransferase domain-containing protein [Paenibacillus sp. HJGM_3]|uniref:class I SAM-dependent methyltransferase n=1 Tax=Paenibacillus sp. HJGM_3 TaxID=3379816 RepID=UPI00385D020B
MFAEQYNAMVVSGRSDSAYQYILEQLERLDALQDKRICDVGCGQGELSYRLSGRGAHVTGVDLSGKLLEFAKRKTEAVTWIQDDAMTLSQLPSGSYDVAVSSVMLVDVPDHLAVFQSVHRILKPDGIMIWAITHPCFQSPFSSPLGDGARIVKDYVEQFWKSEGSGTIRSTLGAYHRPLAQYLNDFIATGFSILRVDEPARLDTSVDNLPLLFAAVGRKIS